LPYHYDPADNLHGTYMVKTAAIYRMIGHTDFAQQVDEFIRSLCIGLWHSQPITEDQVLAINNIYSKNQKRPTYLYWELVTAASKYTGLKIPDFFRVLVITNKRAAEALLVLIRYLLVKLSDPNLSVPSETEFISETTKTLEGIINSEDPLGFSELAVSSPAKKTEQRPEAPADKKEAPKEEQKEEAKPKENLDDLLKELDSLVGLAQIKKDVRSLINLIKVRKLREENGLAVPPLSLHMVFTGNPGTGKTTVARLLSRIYHSIGILSEGTLLEVDRSGLVAGYVGQTALKTKEAVEKAKGGILFVDEAYSLAPEGTGNDFGQEAISIILKSMEDMRNELVVIVAGYPEPMHRFISSNPGLESRFGKYFHFEDYNSAELMQIYKAMCEKNQYQNDEECLKFAEELFKDMYENRDENFGNARDVRNIFERAVANHSNRIAKLECPTREDLMTFRKEDIIGCKEDEAKAE
jgi:SpoVK/Ycf46/Vps4 family AAA+-type ATPase